MRDGTSDKERLNQKLGSKRDFDFASKRERRERGESQRNKKKCLNRSIINNVLFRSFSQLFVVVVVVFLVCLFAQIRVVVFRNLFGQFELNSIKYSLYGVALKIVFLLSVCMSFVCVITVFLSFFLYNALCRNIIVVVVYIYVLI